MEDIEEDIIFQERSRFALKDVSYLEDQEYQWKMIDMAETSAMMDDLNTEAVKADRDLRSLFDAVSTLLESTDHCKFLKFVYHIQPDSFIIMYSEIR